MQGRALRAAADAERYTSFLSVIIKVGSWLTLQVGEIANDNKRLNRKCLARNKIRATFCFLIFKRAESVYRENPEIKQRILSATGKE
jgi:hypothetical protein